MAIYGGQVQTTPYQAPDYGPSVAAARDLAMTQAQGTAGIFQQVGDYFKQQGEKKKLIKKSQTQIDAALKLFPDLAPALQGASDQIRDENIPLSDRVAAAESITGLINMGIGEMRNAQSTLLQQQQLGLEQQYKAAQLGMEAERIDIARQQATKGPTPKFKMGRPTITSPTGEVFEGPELPYDESRGMFFDAKAQKYIADPNLIGTSKEYAPDSAMPSQTSQVGGSSADLIASAAEMNIGKLNTAKTPGTQGGNVGCADAICRTFKQATGEELVPGGTLSTREMATTLENDPRFVKVPLGQAQKGDIVLTPRKGNKAGHTGIVLDGGAIASNSSKGFAGKAPGTFVQNYTIDSWKRSVAPRNPSETAAYRYVGSQGIDNALSMGGDMTQQAMGTPQQQAMLSQQIEQGAGLATAQNSRQGAMPTEPSIATQQPQLPQQATTQWTPPPGFAPVREKGKKVDIVTGTTAQALNLDPRGTYEVSREDGNIIGVQTIKAAPTISETLALEKREEEKVAKQQMAASTNAKSDRMVELMTELKTHPGFSRLFGATWLPTWVEGSEGANAAALFKQIEDMGFMEAIKDMRGMGALSDAEGQKASSAFLGINPKMSEKAAEKKIDEVIKYIKTGQERLQSGKLISQPTPETKPEISEINSYYDQIKNQTPAR